LARNAGHDRPLDWGYTMAKPGQKTPLKAVEAVQR
jgi:hypothetical protein